ncbi:MAG: transglycosylase domain-containing protein [Gordonia sp. (in: high G+C Gram-positive bacteria)]|uniref:penicillin-binding protein n=1 Tax=Gordonia sp. (in: high G+C Gram-positive bacteria) TaxID=84139 RepID=UPI0039E5E345
MTSETKSKLGRLAGAILVSGILVAGLLFPLASGVGIASNKAAAAMENVSSELLNGTVPEVTTMTDVTGKPIALLYDQYRFQVGFNDINPNMMRAIVAIEDRRFFDHDGVDWKGTIRAALKNSSSGEVQQGASTLDQQLIKNYQLFVLSRTEAEKQAATATTPARKLREVRMALTMEQSMTEQARRERGLDAKGAKEEAKKQILTRYLNTVPFGNNAFGIEAAAQTYFGIPARELNIQQAAMLAGLVQSSSALNPYTNPKGATERRNLVLDTMVDVFPEHKDEIEKAKKEPLGILPQPKVAQQGCISAKNSGFLCDYALKFLAENGMSRNTVMRGGYTIRTTLDPVVQRNTVRALQQYASPYADGVAQVASVIKPGERSHDLLAMGSSRNYGLRLKAGETVQPQPFSLVGDGAGSVFKIFTVAAALEKGIGGGSNIPVPTRLALKGMGNSGATNGCPPGMFCVKNDGKYPASMSITNALAQSPNTAFVELLRRVGVPPTVDMSVRLGLRSYTTPGSSGIGDKSIATYVKQGNLGSFTLGPFAINALELSNVAATLSSGGVWCPPNPIAGITKVKRDRYGNLVMGPDGKPAMANVPFAPPRCEQVVDKGLARTMANLMSKDDVGAGTAAAAARGSGWSMPMSGKTGTTEAHRSSAFVGYTNNLAAAVYAYNDGPRPAELCSGPLRQCGYGNLYGGSEPARTWFSAMGPVADKFGPTFLPPVSWEYMQGTPRGRIPNVVGLPASEATARLQKAGFKVTQLEAPSSRPKGSVVFTAPAYTAMPGSQVTIYVSDGKKTGGGPTETTVEVPGVGPVEIQIPG